MLQGLKAVQFDATYVLYKYGGYGALKLNSQCCLLV